MQNPVSMIIDLLNAARILITKLALVDLQLPFLYILRKTAVEGVYLRADCM